MIITEDESGKRLDKFLSEKYPDFSRSMFQKIIKEGKIMVNFDKKPSNYKLKTGDDVNAELPDLQIKLPEPEDLNIEIVYEDEDLAVVNKPSGMVVHPTDEGKHLSGTLVNAILYKFGSENLSNISGDSRPGIVHRLDKDTSGLLIIAKNNKMHRFLIKQMKDRKIEKYYFVLVLGQPETTEGTIDSPLARAGRDYKKVTLSTEAEGREAITKYKVEAVYNFKGHEFAFIKAKILTGRTHQIRVHFAGIDHPVIGDNLYGNKKINSLFDINRFFLHAAELKFNKSDGKQIHIKTDIPEELEKILNKME